MKSCAKQVFCYDWRPHSNVWSSGSVCCSREASAGVMLNPHFHLSRRAAREKRKSFLQHHIQSILLWLQSGLWQQCSGMDERRCRFKKWKWKPNKAFAICSYTASSSTCKLLLYYDVADCAVGNLSSLS
jgi:hypothetical protein